MMDECDGDDLERRLAGRLRPARVLGADETWHRLAPLLGERPQRRPFRPSLLGSAKAVGVVALLAIVLFLTRAVGPRVSPPAVVPVGGSATSGATATPPTGTIVRVVGAGVVSVQPALPFALWQPGYRSLDEHLIAYAYRPEGGQGERGTVSASVDTRGDGRADDPAVAGEAEGQGRALLGDDAGAALALVYAADGLSVGAGETRPAPGPTRLFVVAQRAAAGRMPPPGEAAWFSGTPATFVRQNGMVVLSWLAGDTFLTLTTNQSPEEAVVFAGSLKPLALVAPDAFAPAPMPTLTIPTPLPLALTPRATAAPCPNAPTSTGRRFICPSDPAAPAGKPTFTEADVRRQYAPLPGDLGPFIAVTPPQIGTVEFLTVGEVGVRLGRGMNRPDDQLLCVITLTGDFILPPPDPNSPPLAYRAVILILDARSGDWFATTGTPR